MKRLKLTDNKMIRLFAVMICLGVITCMIPAAGYMPHHLSLICYVSMIMIWSQSIRHRVVDAKVRHHILVACIFMVLLFFQRMCKFTFFPGLDRVNELVWYSYYISMTAIAVFIFLAALYVEPVREPRRNRYIEAGLLVVWAAVCCVVMTNGLHGMVFDITVHPDREYTHRWFYYVIFVWILALAVGTLVLLFVKCSFSAARKLWYVPVMFAVFGSIPIVLFVICGGAPKIGGYKIFQLQEAFCIPFITSVEGILQIGMLPANTGYEKVFDFTSINACIHDMEGKPVLASANWTGDISDEDHRIRRENVSGGYVTWMDDLTAINKLNREIEEVTEQLGDENDLIRKENEVRAERVSFETKNRLYTRIATAVRSRAVITSELLERTCENEDEFRSNIIFAAVLSAYIKRMGNLMLLTDSADTIDSGELRMAVSESMDYVRLAGCACEMVEKNRGNVSSKLALCAYELFETALEDVWSKLYSCIVMLGCDDGFVMTMAIDTMADAITPDWHEQQLKEAGAVLSVKYEDETCYIRLEETR